jgi:hypothetical protein
VFQRICGTGLRGCLKLRTVSPRSCCRLYRSNVKSRANSARFFARKIFQQTPSIRRETRFSIGVRPLSRTKVREAINRTNLSAQTDDSSLPLFCAQAIDRPSEVGEATVEARDNWRLCPSGSAGRSEKGKHCGLFPDGETVREGGPGNCKGRRARSIRGGSTPRNLVSACGTAVNCAPSPKVAEFPVQTFPPATLELSSPGCRVGCLGLGSLPSEEGD